MYFKKNASKIKIIVTICGILLTVGIGLSLTKVEAASAENSEVSQQEDCGDQTVYLNPGWEFASYTVSGTGAATLYRAVANSNGIVIAIDPGHGTKAPKGAKNYCHPDKSPKVTGGTTAKGQVMSSASSGGMQFNDGAYERDVALRLATIIRNKLLLAGYDVLMLRETTTVELDGIARTVIANNVADCHISLHWDSDGLNYDKGAFYISVPNGIKNMYPVSEHYLEHDALGESILSGLKLSGCKIYSKGYMPIDLTQTSFSTIPSVDVEFGNQCSDHSSAKLSQLADGVVYGINVYFSK